MNVLRLDQWRACALASLYLFTAAAGAQGALTLRDAVALAHERNPTLAAFAFETEAARQLAQARALAPPLTVDVQLENFAGTGELSGAQAIEATLQLSKVLELGGKADGRREVGAAELATLETAQLSRRADVIAEVAKRFIHVLSDQAQLEVTRRATTLAMQARDVVAARIREGAISSLFLHRAEIALARARIAQEHAEHELAASRVALSVMWADPVAQFERAEGDLFAFQKLEALDDYVLRMDANPDLSKFASEQRVLAARTRLAQSHRRPNVTLTAGVRRLEGLDEQAWVAGFSVPFGTRERALTEILSVQAEREQLVLHEQSRRLELRSLLFSLYQEILHARTEAEALHVEIRPQADRMVSTTSESYRIGRLSLVELIEAQRELAAIEHDAIRAAADFHTNLIEIERVTGIGVGTPVTR